MPFLSHPLSLIAILCGGRHFILDTHALVDGNSQNRAPVLPSWMTLQRFL